MMVYDPNKFKTQAPTIASFDFTDFLDGTTVRKFFLATQNLSAGNVDNLVPNAEIISGEGERSIGPETTVTFPLIVGFSTSRTIKGNAYINFSAKSISGGTTLRVKLQKITDAGTEDISSTITTESTGGEKPFLAQLPITSEVNFTPGDKIQLSIETVASGSYTVFLGTDPSNTASGNLTNTKTTVFVPFKTEL